jgi:flagellar P-ring protein precursor FlgI
MVSKPPPFSDGETVVVPRSDVTVDEELKNMIVVDPGTSIARIADAMNALGVSPRDMMSLFLALRDAGALHADLVQQ